MLRLIAFDLDGTLAEIGREMTEENTALLRQLERSGVTIAICSGKPLDYLCGFARQLGLQQPVLVGENGAVMQIGVDLPPKTFFIQPYSTEAKQSIQHMRAQFDRLLPDLWYQPNLVGLTPFPKNDAEFDIIARCLEQNRDHLRDVTVYRHADSYDITPSSIDKFSGMQCLGSLLHIPPEETGAVGDGVNDYPMFDYAGYAVGIHVAEESRVHINFPDITHALKHLIALTTDRGEFYGNL